MYTIIRVVQAFDAYICRDQHVFRISILCIHAEEVGILKIEETILLQKR